MFQPSVTNEPLVRVMLSEPPPPSTKAPVPTFEPRVSALPIARTIVLALASDDVMPRP